MKALTATEFDGILISGVLEQIPGMQVTSCLSRPDLALKIGEDCHRAPGREISLIVLHGTMGGWPQAVLETQVGPGDLAERNAYYWRHSKRNSGTHLIVDQDGSVLCCADVADVVAYGSGRVNSKSIQIEMAQSSGNTVTRAQLKSTALLVKWLCDRFSLPKRFTSGYSRALADFVSGKTQWRGVTQHCYCSDLRGRGDAGTEIELELQRIGFSPVDVRDEFASGEGKRPSWLLPSDEVQSREMGASQNRHLSIALLADSIQALGLGLSAAQSLELLAHAACESSWLRRDVANNFWGWKATAEWAEGERRAGRRALWWQRQGHKGEAPRVYYRGFASLEESVKAFVEKFCPRVKDGTPLPQDPATGDYRLAGQHFWAKRPENWFPALIAAGYRGSATEAEPTETIAEHVQLVRDCAESWAQHRLGVQVDGIWGPRSSEALRSATGYDYPAAEALDSLSKRVQGPF